MPLRNVVRVALSGQVHRIDRLVEPEGHRQIAKVELQRLDDLRVDEVDHAVAAFHDRDPGAERGEHGGVLDADDPGADDDHRGRDMIEVEHAVGVDDAPLVELDLLRPRGPGAGGDDDLVRGELELLVAEAFGHQHRVRVEEARGALEVLHVVAVQLGAHHLGLAGDHVVGARREVGDGDVLLHLVARAVELALVGAGEVEHRFAQRLRRDRAGVDADAADHALAVDDGDPPAQLRRSDGGALPAGAAADDEQLEFLHRTPPGARDRAAVLPQ